MRFGDDGARDGYPAPHPAGKLGRVKADCVFQLHEAQCLDDATVNFLRGEVLFVEAVGDVFLDR